MAFEIKHQYSVRVIYASEKASDLREAVLEAIEAKVDLSDANLSEANLSDANLRNANLSDANLRDANLRNANLRDANLSDANLRNANLSDANLRNANLSEANLRDANLSDANLRNANLRNANLRDANLSDANLRNANLSEANLSDANLRNANLQPIRRDFEDILFLAVGEIPGLRLALVEGRVDGTCYEGSCACLVGTIANVRGCSYRTLGALQPDASRPAERFFTNITPGCTPETSQSAAIAVQWIDEFNQKFDDAMAARKPVVA
jgi:hypothetical protein